MEARGDMQTEVQGSPAEVQGSDAASVSPRSRWVSVAFFGAAILVGALTYALLRRAGSLWELEARLRPFKIQFELLLPIVSSVVGFGTYGILWANTATRGFTEEVVDELSGVTWPKPEDVRGNTVVVVVMVIVSAVILGLLDRFWTAVIGAIL